MQTEAIVRAAAPFVLVVSCLVISCNQDAPEPRAANDTSQARYSLPSAIGDSTAQLNFDTLGGAITGQPDLTLTPEMKVALVNDVRKFMTTIDSGNQRVFWQSLAVRSRRLADAGTITSPENIWNAARETLGDIHDRRITVIGGTRDSAALLVEGLRLIDGERKEDPIIIHLFREDESWKVMYPGLQYPRHYLHR